MTVMAAVLDTTLEKKNSMCNYTSECQKTVFGRGMCSQHYFQVHRAEKRLIDGPKDRKRRSDAFEEMDIDYEDFWQFVKKEVGIQ